MAFAAGLRDGDVALCAPRGGAAASLAAGRTSPSLNLTMGFTSSARPRVAVRVARRAESVAVWNECHLRRAQAGFFTRVS